jgi:hypothetical protein
LALLLIVVALAAALPLELALAEPLSRAADAALVSADDPAEPPDTLTGSPPRSASAHRVVPWWLLLTSLLALALACPLGRRRSIALDSVS